MAAPGCGQFASTARVRLLPTTHCVYVQPSAITAQTCSRVAPTSRVVAMSCLAFIARTLRILASIATEYPHQSSISNV